MDDIFIALSQQIACLTTMKFQYSFTNVEWTFSIQHFMSLLPLIINIDYEFLYFIAQHILTHIKSHKNHHFQIYGV